jgi:large subunit ribosomal protein L30
MADKLRITLRKSLVGTNPSARGTVRALGLRRIGQTVEVAADPALRGQVRAVRYLLDVEELSTAPTPRKADKSKKEEAEA